MTTSTSDRQSARSLRALLLGLCVLIYVVGMWILIAQAASAPMRPLIEVRYGLVAYGGVAVSCIVAMVLFARRVPVEAPSARGDTE
jgi:hypothetical protein